MCYNADKENDPNPSNFNPEGSPVNRLEDEARPGCLYGNQTITRARTDLEPSSKFGFVQGTE